MAKGIDPASPPPTPEAPLPAPVFEDVLADWLKRDKPRRTNDDIRRMIDKDATPAFARRPIDSIKRHEVLAVIDAVVDRGSPVTARRLYAWLHRFFRWSVGRGLIAANPLADAPKPGKENKRDRVLSDAELLKAWQAAATIGYPFGPIVQLLILTGARRSEIAALEWREIDEDEIRLGGSRTKTGEPHTIPLSHLARNIIAKLPRNGELVFSDPRFVSRRRPVSGWSRMKRRLDALAKIDPWVLHDLRRTTATGLQRLGVAPQVIEAVLGHASGTRAGVAGTYQRHDFAAEMCGAVEAWGSHVAALIGGKPRGKVVPMRRRAG